MGRLSIVALIYVAQIFFTPAFAFEDRRSVETLLAGCRYQALKPAPVQDSEWESAFQCRDALRVVVADGPKQPKFMSVCVPASIPEHEIARALVKVLERNPERYKERFDMRAASALHEVWPCP